MILRTLFVLLIGLGGMAMAAPELSSSGVPQREAQVLSSLYLEAQRRLQQMVLHPKGGTKGSRDYAQARAATQLAQVDRVLNQLAVASNAWIGKNVPQVFH